MAKKANETNNYRGEDVKRLVGKIEAYKADLDSERGSYMQRCKSIREDINNVYEEAKALGLPRKELKVLVDTREKVASAVRSYNDLEADQRVTVDMLAEAFGDAKTLPLFQAAIAAAAA